MTCWYGNILSTPYSRLYISYARPSDIFRGRHIIGGRTLSDILAKFRWGPLALIGIVPRPRALPHDAIHLNCGVGFNVAFTANWPIGIITILLSFPLLLVHFRRSPNPPKLLRTPRLNEPGCQLGSQLSMSSASVESDVLSINYVEWQTFLAEFICLSTVRLVPSL